MTLTLTDNNFKQEVLDGNLPVLVDFYADWCGPCAMMGPIVEELSEEYGGTIKIGKLNVNDNPDVVDRYHVMSIPTFILFKNGEAKETFIGGMSKDELKDKLDAHL